MPVRNGSAEWRGGLKGGHGNVTIGNDVWNGQYSFSSRFEEGSGTNPEELIGAAHAACFSMAFSATLEGAGHTPKWVRTTAKVSVVPEAGGFSINKIDLECEGSVPGITADQFQELGAQAKAGCPVSRALAGTQINLHATLVDAAAA
jgi:osmotically inducible protein OsmC